MKEKELTLSELTLSELTLSWLCRAYPQIQWHNFRDCTFQQVYNDSRRVTPNSLFFALAGEKENGENYITEAIAKGAIACILEKNPTQEYLIPYGITPSARKILAEVSHTLCGNPTEKMFLIGITGTNGKTTTSFFIYNILKVAGYSTGLLGTMGYFYGDSSYPASHTTPDSLVLNEHFKQMYDQNISHVVMEVSSHSLALKRVAHLTYHAAIFTNLSRDHLDYHKDMDNYRTAKSLLFRELPPDATAIFNYDDPSSLLIANLCPASPTWYSLSKNPNVEVYAQNICELDTGTDFELVTPDGMEHANILLPGQYNVYNALSASACCWKMGIPLKKIVEGISTVTVPGRMQKIKHNKSFHVWIDFAHTDQALERALSTLHQIKKNRLFVVFGCGGNRDAGKRPLMGKVAEKYADFTWITSDNPREENPQDIANSIAQGFTSAQKYTICLDRYQAISQAITQARTGDTILIAGKGHETGQIIGKQVIPFSDEKVALEILSSN